MVACFANDAIAAYQLFFEGIALLSIMSKEEFIQSTLRSTHESKMRASEEGFD